MKICGHVHIHIFGIMQVMVIVWSKGRCVCAMQAREKGCARITPRTRPWCVCVCVFVCVCACACVCVRAFVCVFA